MSRTCLPMEMPPLEKGEIECSRDSSHPSGPLSLYKRLTKKGDQAKDRGESVTRPKDAEAHNDPKTLCDSIVYSFDLSAGSPHGSHASKEVIDTPKVDTMARKPVW